MRVEEYNYHNNKQKEKSFSTQEILNKLQEKKASQEKSRIVLDDTIGELEHKAKLLEKRIARENAKKEEAPVNATPEYIPEYVIYIGFIVLLFVLSSALIIGYETRKKKHAYQ